jgi:4-oxalocrotonate tautomerase family enzyme
MPYVNVKLAGESTAEQRKEIADRIASALEDVLGKPKKASYIVFEDVARDYWAVGDRLLNEPKPD